MSESPFPESSSPQPAGNEIVTVQPRSFRKELVSTEDWWAIWIGGLLLLVCTLAVVLTLPADLDQKVAAAKQADEKFSLTSPLKPYIAKPTKWGQLQGKSEKGEPEAAELTIQEQMGNPLQSLQKGGKSLLPGIVGVFALSSFLFGLGVLVMGGSGAAFVRGFWFVFLLALFAYVLSEQVVVSYYNLENALWALGMGLLISNTVGTPAFVKPALRTEFYIKTGLVLLGAEVLISRLIELGLPGIFVAWVVTPIVLISTYVFGQKVLKMESRSLNMVISADMSVCGVSAAIATAAACKAKKEELSFAIGLSLAFTVIMMIVLPAVIKLLGIGPVLGGAWLGGTIDSTGAVAAAGGLLGDVALEVATTIKMIQNILIGVTAFGVAVYWVSYVERKSPGASPAETSSSQPQIAEIWRRFPKFVLGFVAASLCFSALYFWMEHGPLIVGAVVGDSTKVLRGWFFCLAFVSIGLETDFRELTKFLKGGKPLMLYVCGQSLNLLLTHFMAWLMFEVVFRDMTARLTSGL